MYANQLWKVRKVNPSRVQNEATRVAKVTLTLNVRRYVVKFIEFLSFLKIYEVFDVGKNKTKKENVYVNTCFCCAGFWNRWLPIKFQKENKLLWMNVELL